MRSRAWFLVFCAAFAVAGCDEGGSTTVISGDTLIGNFPGTEIIEYVVGDDGRAVNHSGAKVNKGLQIFWNSSNGHAIILYIDGWERLWAHHWDGTRLTPGVELRGPNQEDLTQDDEDDSDQDFETFEHYRVLFLNTNTGGRNGDAIILWVRGDDPNPALPAEGSNHRLFGTYFDVSESGNVTSVGDPTVHYGFESSGSTIDFNNGNSDVDDFGFVSNSLRFTHAFDERDQDSIEWLNRFDEGSENALTPATQSGDPTTYVWFVWRKDQTDLTGVGVSNRYHAIQFNLAQIGNSLPVQVSLGQGTIAPTPGVTIADAQPVEHGFVVHNGCMIWQATASIGATGLFLTRFDQTGNLGTIELSESVEDSLAPTAATWAGTFPEMVLPTNVYGDDHGLTNLYAFFNTDEFPGRIAVTKVDLTTVFNQAAREINQLENLSGAPVEEFQAKKGDYAPETRINRTGQWIFVTWLQSTLVPLTEQLAGFAGGTRQIHMHGIQTGARSLVNSIVTGGPFLAPNQVGAVSNQTGRLFIQEEIADGTQDPRCGIQSNLNRINLVWHEGFPQIDLKHNGLTIALSTSATVPPTGGPSVATGGLITLLFDSTSGNTWEFDGTVPTLVTDLGTADGSPLVYYVNNANNALDPNAPGAFDELRVFGHAGIPGATPADSQLVSTDGPAADNSLNTEITDPNQFDDNGVDDYTEPGGHFLRGRTTPTSTAAGPHGGTRFHLFWVEARHGENSRPALRTRYFTKSAFSPASAAATFTTAHAPSLATAPRSLGGLNNDEEFLPPTVHPNGRRGNDVGPFYPFCTSVGNTVGVYFTTTGHFWYQEFNGTAWLDTPEIIDNESGANLFMGRDQRACVFPPMLLNTCDNLNGTILIYSKPPPGDDPGHRRLEMRVRD